ncbi:MAG: hypothetical protein RL094_778 [Candidatus Parcubacteria bacterium]|jgi:Tfp pilus assembly protein PilO
MRLFLPIIFILASVGLFIGFTNPQYQATKLKDNEQKKIQEANKKAAQLRAVRETLTQERNQISEIDIQKVKKLLPDGVENVGLIIDINNIAAKYGVNIKNTRINEGSTNRGDGLGPDGNKFGSISLAFTINTGYDNFLAFLRDLESSLRLVDVTSLSFASTRDGKYDFGVTLQTYWLK